MNLTEQTITGNSCISVNDSLNAALLELHMKPSTNAANYPDESQIIIYVDKNPQNNPSDERKTYVFDGKLFGLTGGQDELVQELKIVNNEPILDSYIIRRVGRDTSLIDPHYLLSEETIESVESIDITLFEGTNYIYSNYPTAEFTIIYPKNTASNKYYVSALSYARHKENAADEFSLDDIYFKDAFTKTGQELNEEIDNLNVKCITSKNNTFSLDSQGNLVVNSITYNSSDGLLDLVYPVGSIYMSVNNVDPSTVFGGTWEKIKDKFLLSSGDTYMNGNTGGEATHTLTVDEIPAHTHTWNQNSCTNPGNHTHIVGADKDGGGGYNRYTVHISGNTTASGQEYSPLSGAAGSHTHTITGTNTQTGGGIAHNNMPPYLVVNVWKRTA